MISGAGIFVHSTLPGVDVEDRAEGKIWIYMRGRRDRIWIIRFPTARQAWVWRHREFFAPVSGGTKVAEGTDAPSS